MRPQDMVAEFHRATGATIGDTPAIRDGKLRYDLISEELTELWQAMGCHGYDQGNPAPHPDCGCQCGKEPDLVAAIDALADLLYVVYGAAVTFGIDIEPFFAEVHRSNMTKVGGPVREDGKRLKPDTYEPPNLAPILEIQTREGEGRLRRKADPNWTCNGGPGTECTGFGYRPHSPGPQCPTLY